MLLKVELRQDEESISSPRHPHTEIIPLQHDPVEKSRKAVFLHLVEPNSFHRQRRNRNIVQITGTLLSHRRVEESHCQREVGEICSGKNGNVIRVI